MMATILALGFWPWLLAAAHAFAASVVFMPRILYGNPKRSLPFIFAAWSIGGAAGVAVLAGLIEAANQGILAGDRAQTIELVLWLAGLGALIGFLPATASFGLPRHKGRNHPSS